MNKIINSLYEKYIIQLAIIIFLVSYCFNQAITGKSADFMIFYKACNNFFETGILYNTWYFVKETAAGQYLYSPFSIYFFKIFVYLPYTISLFIWLLLNLFFLYRIYILLSKYILIDKNYKWIISFAILLSLRFILCVFERGQLNIFILYLMLESLFLISSKKHVLASFYIAFGIMLKIMPIVLIPYLIYRREFKTIPYIFIFCTLMILTPAIHIGWHKNIKLHKEWLSTINPINAQKDLDNTKTEKHIHSINTFIGAYLMNNDKANFPRRYIINLSAIQVEKTILIVRIALVLMFLYFLHTRPFVSDVLPEHKLWELSYLFICTVLIFPHQQKYAFVFIIPACFYISYQIFFYRLYNYKPILALLIYLTITIFSSNLIFGFEWKDIAEYYKTLTIGAIIVTLLLFYYKPASVILKSNSTNLKD